jgi:hypothetical protein
MVDDNTGGSVRYWQCFVEHVMGHWRETILHPQRTQAL